MYHRVHFEISAACNGRCPWCPTGRERTRRGLSATSSRPSGGFADFGRFERAVRHMLDNGILREGDSLYLFNYGEPLLHPRLRDIVEFLGRTGLRFSISTNASTPVLFDRPDALKHLDYLIFSMSGFSQGSYDRIHGFDFGRIRENIATMVANYRECAFTGKAEILFHVYQFNVDEIEPAREFAESLGIGFSPYMAYFAGYLMMRSYLVGEMPYEELKRASSELFLFYVEGRRKEAPAGYRCPQFDFLTLDEECRVVTCCALEKEAPDYLIGDLFDLPPERIRRMKESRGVCAECGRLGINYLFHNPYILSPGRPAGGARR